MRIAVVLLLAVALLGATVWLLAGAARADEGAVLPTGAASGYPGPEPYPGPLPEPEPYPGPDAYPGPAYLPVVVETGGEAYP
jgi:hypothetical protein